MDDMRDEPAVTVQTIGVDISMAEVWKKMTGGSDQEYARLQRGYETCEWHPIEKRAANSGNDPGSCTRIARVCVGKNGAWHLCERCAVLPEFKRFKAREPLMRGQMSREPMSKIMKDASNVG